MQQPSRRSLLVSTAGALALGTAGCLGRAAPADDSRTDTSDGTDDDAVPQELDDALGYVYRPEGDGGTVLRISRHESDPGSERMGLHPTLTEVGDPSWVVYVGAQAGTASQTGLVATGSFDAPGDTDKYTPDGSRGDFERFRIGRDEEADDRLLATDGETVLLGSPDWVASTLDRHESGEETFVEETTGVEPLLSSLAFAGQTVVVDDDEIIREPFSEQDVDEAALPDLLAVDYRRTDEEVAYTIGGWFEQPPESANVDALETFLTSQLGMDDPTVEVREEAQVAIASGTRPYTPPEERPETAGIPRFHGYDADAGEVLLRFDRGEPLPVDRYELEIDGEVYDGDWARGQDRIGEGDVIAVDADAIEPGDDLSVSYESPDGSFGSSTGTSALRRLPFRVDYDPDARTATITYGEAPPIAGDRLRVLVGDDESTHRPWDGTLTQGDAVTVSDLPIDTYLEIEYERSDGETVRVGGHPLTAPGRFAFDYDGQAEALTITYPEREVPDSGRRPPGATVPDNDPLPADRYEVVVDGEPASRQWTDHGEQIGVGDILELEDVPVDTEVTVYWVGEDGDRHEVDGTVTVPDAEFAFAYDAENEELTVRHDGGQPVSADRLTIRLHGPEDRTASWDGTDSITEGDEHVLEDVDEQAFVVVTYGDRRLLARTHVQELLDGE